MELKEPKSFRDLVTRLKEHGIEVSNDEYAEAFFKNVSYYRLSGYALQYRLAPNNSDCYPGPESETFRSLTSWQRSSLKASLTIICSEANIGCTSQLSPGNGKVSANRQGYRPLRIVSGTVMQPCFTSEVLTSRQLQMCSDILTRP